MTFSSPRLPFSASPLLRVSPFSASPFPPLLLYPRNTIMAGVPMGV